MKDEILNCSLMIVIGFIALWMFWEPILLMLGGLCVLSFLCKHRVWILQQLRDLMKTLQTRKTSGR